LAFDRLRPNGLFVIVLMGRSTRGEGLRLVLWLSTHYQECRISKVDWPYLQTKKKLPSRSFFCCSE